MEITSEELAKIQGLLSTWKESPELECEATFGPRGTVDLSTFLRIASRLRSKGFQESSLEEYLTISLPDQIRLRLTGIGMIEEYCRTEDITRLPFTAMIKDRQTTVKDDTIQLSSYDVRVKARREVSMSPTDPELQAVLLNWSRKAKYFRLIRRWRFTNETLYPGLVIEMSMIRSTKTNKDTGKTSVRSFKDQPLTSFQPTYEVELEIEHTPTMVDLEPRAITQKFLKGVGEVLRGLQNSPLLIRKSVGKSVLDYYQRLTGTSEFRGNAPITLEKKNMTSLPEVGEGETIESVLEAPNIRTGYNVTDKADGLRVHGIVDDNGELFLMDMTMNIYRTGLRSPNEECRACLLDGEYVTEDDKGKGTQRLLLFDIYFANGKDVSKLPFRGGSGKEGRYTNLEAWVRAWATDLEKAPGALLEVSLKTFLFGRVGDLSIFQASKKILDMKVPYHQDGLIFTPNEMSLPEDSGVRFADQFKWKPAKDNTVDFLIHFVKDETTGQEKVLTSIHPGTDQIVRFMTLQLFVASRDDPTRGNPRQAVLFKVPLGESDNLRAYRPVPFLPTDFPDMYANVANIEVKLDPVSHLEYVETETLEPIRDRSIVEMRFDPSKPAGWRWIPMRIRADKTERFLSGTIERTLNNARVAENVWNSIHDPVTTSMICTGNEAPSKEEQDELVKDTVRKLASEQKAYFARKEKDTNLFKIERLKRFHSELKESILYNVLSKKGRKIFLDLAVGQGNDLQIWRRKKLEFVFGIDYAGQNITAPDQGAYGRLINMTRGYAREIAKGKPALPLPTVFFAIGDSSKRVITGESAGDSVLDADIMRAICGKHEAQQPLPPLVDEKGRGRLAEGADGVICMFAIHYFFESEDKFDGFLQNVADNLKVGGLFVGTCFDGESVFTMLRNIPKGGRKAGMDDSTILWEIIKEYEGDRLPIDEHAFGMPITVKFLSIGESHREWLVPFELLVTKMKSIGCELLTPEECAEVGLQHSTNTFKNTHEMILQKHKDEKIRRLYDMNYGIKQFSYLNRWFIFKRKREGEEEAEVAAEVEEELGEEAAAPVAPSGIASVAAAEGVEPSLVASAQQTDDCIPAVARAAAATGIDRRPGTGVPVAVTTAGVTRRPGLEETPRTDLVASMLRGEAASLAEAGADAAVALADGKKYKKTEILLFSLQTNPSKVLGLEDELAARWLSPGAPFSITDPDTGTVFPSAMHYIMSMELNAAGRPDLGAEFLGRDSDFHVTKAGEREGKSMEERYSLYDKEQKLITDQLFKAKRKYKLTIDDAQLSGLKDAAIEEAIRQRFQRDPKFCRVVDAMMKKGRFPVYYTGPGGSEFGGDYLAEKGIIVGQNKIGKAIFAFASANPDKVKECASSETLASGANKTRKAPPKLPKKK